MDFMVTQKELRRKISSLSDKELYEILSNTQDYASATLEVANEEIQKRGGIETIKLKVQTDIEKDVENEIKLKQKKKNRTVYFIIAMIFAAMVRGLYKQYGLQGAIIGIIIGGIIYLIAYWVIQLSKKYN